MHTGRKYAANDSLDRSCYQGYTEFVILASSRNTKRMEFEVSHRIDFIVVALVTLLFYGVVVVWRVIKEKNASAEV